MLSFEYMQAQLTRSLRNCKDVRKMVVERVLAATKFLHKKQTHLAREQMILAIGLLKRSFNWKPGIDKKMPKPFRQPAMKQIFRDMVERLHLQPLIT